MQVGEDKEYSTLASVELRRLFPSRKVRAASCRTFICCWWSFSKLIFFAFFQINKVTEMNLSANQERAEMEKRRLIWKVEGSTDEPEVKRGGPVDPEELVVELAPMEIRTFLLDFDYLRKSYWGTRGKERRACRSWSAGGRTHPNGKPDFFFSTMIIFRCMVLEEKHICPSQYVQRVLNLPFV